MQQLLFVNEISIENIIAQQGVLTEIINSVSHAYMLHYNNKSTLPHSVFLKLNNGNRIIALPASLSDNEDIIGLKWISSFPKNIELGKSRSSALIILNSPDDGHPISILNGNLISALRTVISAYLTINSISIKDKVSLGIIGCGYINLNILRLLNTVHYPIDEINIFDIIDNRANEFVRKSSGIFNNISIKKSLGDIISKNNVVSIATTSKEPYLYFKDYKDFSPQLLLNISLRDLDEEWILNSINVVDDIDHVNRENTSINRSITKYGIEKIHYYTMFDLINCNNNTVLLDKPIVYNAFGLGILDIAVAHYIYKYASENRMGQIINY
jgi:N-[(2S)-2-amino-2-carboxyethyl]-L-glutamate dehydrogenase